MLLGAVVLLLVGRLAFHRGWPGTRRASRWLTRHRAQLVAFVEHAPATFVYLAIITVTTWVLVGANSRLEHHLMHDPVHVLIRSAFWLDDYRELALWIVLFLLVLAPAERWLGTARWFATFVAGHVGATLLTALGVWIAIRTGLSSTRLENVVDVGVSYGFCAVAALFTFRLPARWRPWYAGALVAFAVVAIAVDGSFTSYGHLTAMAIGFALFPFSRAPAVRARANGPLLLPDPPALGD